VALTWDERPKSREVSSNPPSETRHYVAGGLHDPASVEAWAWSLTPQVIVSNHGFLHLQDIRVSPEGHKLAYVEAVYGKKKQQVGSFRLSFDTTGGTVRIKTSRSTIQKYPEDAPSHRQAIGVKRDGDPEGCDVIIPSLKINVHFKHPTGIITLQRIKQLARSTGAVNSVRFLTFRAGEVLFAGAVGDEGTDTETEVTYQLLMSENATGLSIGDVANNIQKDGHDYLWVEFKELVDGGKRAVAPKHVYVERVYRRLNLAAILGFGA
jgi:hypothetical protein